MRYLCLLFGEVDLGHSHVPSMRKHRSCVSCCGSLRGYGVPALPNAAGSRNPKPHDRRRRRAYCRLAGVAAYSRLDEYTRLRAPGCTFVCRIRHCFAAGYTRTKDFAGTGGSVKASVGLIGLGLMGHPIAVNLLNKGFSLTVWNRTASRAQDLVSQGARLAATPHEAAAASEVLMMI